MVRHLILSALLATGTLTAVAPATAEPPQPAPHFEVLVYRDSRGWQSEGKYRTRMETTQAAVRWWREGYRVEVRQF